VPIFGREIYKANVMTGDERVRPYKILEIAKKKCLRLGYDNGSYHNFTILEKYHDDSEFFGFIERLTYQCATASEIQAIGIRL
jgi:hypothetical protein